MLMFEKSFPATTVEGRRGGSNEREKCIVHRDQEEGEIIEL